MEKVKDFKWKQGMSVKELVENMGNIGFQSVELKKASDVIVKMKKNNAKIFLSMVVDNGGYETAKTLLSAAAPQYGFEKLWEAGRLDLTMEALVLNPKYKPLFTQQELGIARKRLLDHGYKFDKSGD